MNKNAQFSLIFCEDFRVEIGDKPMIIGILSPVVYIEGGDLEDADEAFNLVTSFVLPAEVDKIDLRLDVEISRPNADVVKQAFRRSVERNVDADHAEPWSAMIPLPLTIANCVPGTRVEANLSTKYGEAWASLLVQPSSVGEIEPVVSRKPRASKKSKRAA